MVNVIVIAILIIPWLIIPFNDIPEPTRLIKAAFFDFAMMGVIVMALINGLKFEYKNKYLAWFSIVVFVTMGLNWYLPLLKGQGYNAGTIESCLHYILALTAFYLICSNFERSDFIRCAKAMCISSTLVSIFCIFQSVGLDPMSHLATYTYKEPRHIAALLDHPDMVGNYLCLVLPLFIYFNKPKYYIGMALCVITLLLTKSSLSVFSAVIGISIYTTIKYAGKRMVLGIVALGCILFFIFCFINKDFNKINNGFTGRTEAWSMMVKRMDNPLFGRGLGIVKSLNVQTGALKADGVNRENFWMFAHNDYLETYCSVGAVGLFLLLLVIINSIRRFNFKSDNRIGYAYFGCFFAFLIVMFGSFPMEFPPLALNGLILFAGIEKT